MISRIREFVGRVPWWGWMAGVVLVLFVVNLASGAIYSKKLWNMVRSEIVADEKRIIEEREKFIGQLLLEKQGYLNQIEGLKKEKGYVQKERDGYAADLRRIRNQRETIIVPTDPSLIMDEFHKRGYKSLRRILPPGP